MVLIGPTPPDAGPAEATQAEATQAEAPQAEAPQAEAPQAEATQAEATQAERPGPAPDSEPHPATATEGASGPSGVAPPVAGRRRSPLVWLVPLVVVVLVGIGAGAFFLGRTTKPVATVSTTTTPPVTAPNAKMTTYRNTVDGFSVQYPANWKRISAGSGGLLLGAGNQDGARIQVERLGTPVNTRNVADMKAFTDSVLSAKSLGLTVVLQRAVKLNGVIGYYYLYTFPYPGNQTGVHSLYFLFQGRKMTMITFQALPSSDFKALAPVFDRIALSYRSNPAVLGPVPTPASSITTTTKPAAASTTTTKPAGTTATTAKK